MSKILQLQSLRGILCLIVVFVHFTPYENLLIHNHYLAGIAVITFFILSGYVLTLNYLYRINSIDNLKIFFKKRFFRLYPLHLFFLLLFVIIEFIKYYLNLSYFLDINSEIFKENNLYSFLTNFFFVNSLNNYLSFNLPSWAVSAEFISSLIFGITILIFKNYFYLLSMFIFTLFVLIFNLNDYNLIQYNGFFSLYSCILSYYLGAILFFYNKKKFFINFIMHPLLQILNLLIFIFIITIQIKTFIVLVNISIILIYLINLNSDNKLNKFLTNQILVSLGNISYSIYLSHYVIYWGITQVFRHILKLESINSYTNNLYIIENYHIYIIKLSISVVITLIISKYLFIFVEKKFEYKK